MKCPIKCPCLCHDTGGGAHNHPGRPCWGKTGEPVPDDWVPMVGDTPLSAFEDYDDSEEAAMFGQGYSDLYGS